MPYAGVDIPSIQLAILESYLKKRDIHIKTRHLYLKAAEFYGINNYNLLIYPPKDSYTAQMVFSKYVFPEHWKKNKEKFKEYFNKTNTADTHIKQHFTFDEYVQSTDNFYNWVLANVDWQQCDIIGFTLNYGQFLPSLAIAKKIKERNPEKKIVFGGSRTSGELGKKLLESFPYVDFIVSGDGEEPLHRLAYDYQNYESIPNLIYRKQNEIVWNQSENLVDLNSLPLPLYDSFYEELSSRSPEIQQFFYYNGKLPIEISRGCWWNKCTFCNLNIQHKKYREKNVDKIVEEIEFLSNKYKILNFQIISNNLPAKDHQILCEKIKQLGKDFTFFAEARADHLNSEDYILLKEAGFNTIQTGVESFGSNYLRKMNKGARVIDNIAALKFCRENMIKNNYNLIINYPNEELIDFEETKKTIKQFKQYLEPPQICYLRVLYGSPIHCNPDQFNISQLEYTDIDKLMFPREVLDKGICFVYSFKNENLKINDKWKQLVDNWKIERELLKIEGIKSQNIIDQLIFYYADGGNFVKIYDKRNLKDIQIFTLDELEREIFLSCVDIISLQELKDKFSTVPEEEICEILKGFEESSIIFREEDQYLSLPLSYSKVYRGLKKEKIGHDTLVTQVS
jgi:ribosomal peptide maturation radical SAM protein 1